MIIKKIKQDFLSIYKHMQDQGVWVLIGRIYLMLIALLLSILLTRFLSVEQYGEYKYLLSVLALIAIFSLPETSQIIIRYLPRKHDYIYLDLTFQRIKFSLLGSLTLGIMGLYSYYTEDIGLAWFYFVLALINPFSNSFTLYNPLLQAKLKYKELNKLLIIKSTVQLIIVLLTLLLFDSVYLILIFITLAVAIVDIIFFFQVKKRYMKIKKTPQNLLKRFKSESLILSIIGILPIVEAQFDKILIAKYVDYEAVAIFSIGYFFGKTINSFFKPFLSTINAKLVHRKLEVRHFLIVLFMGTIFGWILSVFVKDIIHFIYGEQYIDSAIYANIVLYSMGLYFFNTIYFNQGMFNKDSNLNKIYIINTIIPLLLMLYMFIVVICDKDDSMTLTLIAMAYPIQLVLSLVLLGILNYKGKKV